MEYDFRKQWGAVLRPLPHGKGNPAGSIRLPEQLGWHTDCTTDPVGAATEDLCGFLENFGVCARECEEKNAFFAFRTDETLGEREYGISCSSARCTVRGGSPRALAQGIYALEFEMRVAGGARLPAGEKRVEMPYSPRMVHSAHGLDEYPDDYLSVLAHDGYDAILVFVKGVDESPAGPIDCNDLVRRAARFGIEVYGYCYLSNFTHPREENAAEIFDRCYGKIFEHCPGMKGMVFVGESVEFASRDPHVSPRRYFEPTEDRLPPDRPTPGWWPCSDYPEWIALVRDSIRRYRADADVMFWTYNFGWAPKKDRLALIRTLPTDVSLLVTFEMFQSFSQEGVEESVSDYSLTCAESGPYFESEAEAAKERGIRLYSMVNTAGRTWDFGVLPYLPMPDQWLLRCRSIERARKKWGLCGLMESHHYGYFPNFAAKCNGLCFAGEKGEDALRRALLAEYGTAGESLIAGLSDFNAAIRLLPPTIEDQYGPCRVGTAYPLCLIAAVQPKQDPDAYFGNAIWTPAYGQFEGGLTLGFGDKGTPYALRQEGEIRNVRKMIRLISAGLKKIRAAEKDAPRLGELVNLGEYLLCCVRTLLHVKLFYRDKIRLKGSQTPQALERIALRMKAVALREIENAKQSIAFLERDSRLGYEPTMLYGGGADAVRWKIRQTERMIESELSYYLDAARRMKQGE